ncbi:MAG: CopD family protein [Verrucomicrobiota bacterium]
MTGKGAASAHGERWLALLWRALALAMLLLPAPARATEEFARQTGKPCSACHVDPSGGGELTGAGKAFLAARSSAGRAVSPSPFRHAIRFVAGYLHLLTAVMWFGTILYVHLLLKPAYASRGLPRGELIVGWGSIALIAVTGAVLTYYRVPSLSALVHTRFGILLTIKIGIFLVMATTAFVVTFVVGPRLKGRRPVPRPDGKEMTPEELAACTGQDGAPALFAYKGTVFDASGSKLWEGGTHFGKHQAGFDLTDALRQAPHGEDRILRLPAVKKLVEPAGHGRRPPHLRAFYFMTYLNLLFVLSVLFIIALWRWW